MSRAGIKLGATLCALSAFALVVSAVAVAAVSVSLGSPSGKHVRRGHIRLVVTVNGSGGGTLFVIMAPRRQVSHGHLNATCAVTMACATLKLHPWGGHPGKWVYTGPWYTFNGSWSSSAGKRFWQGQYFCPGNSCQIFSGIGSFRVT